MRTFSPERGDAARGDLHCADRLAGEGMLDLDLVGLELSADAADREVAPAVNDEARVGGQPVGHGVGTETLAGTAGIELQAGRTDTTASSSSTEISRQRCSGLGRAGRRGGAPASASVSDAGVEPSSEAT